MKLKQGQELKVEGRKGTFAFRRWIMQPSGMAAEVLQDGKQYTIRAIKLRPARGKAKIEIPEETPEPKPEKKIAAKSIKKTKQPPAKAEKATVTPIRKNADSYEEKMLTTIAATGRYEEKIPLGHGNWPAGTVRKRIMRVLAKAEVAATVKKEGDQIVAIAHSVVAKAAK